MSCASTSLGSYWDRSKHPPPSNFYVRLAAFLQVLVLDEVVDGLIAEAERGAEAAGLAVGLLGGGVACYALLGWWTDLALPGEEGRRQWEGRGGEEAEGGEGVVDTRHQLKLSRWEGAEVEGWAQFGLSSMRRSRARRRRIRQQKKGNGTSVSCPTLRRRKCVPRSRCRPPTLPSLVFTRPLLTPPPCPTPCRPSGAGPVTCSAVAGAAGHYRAKLAAQRTRRR